MRQAAIAAPQLGAALGVFALVRTAVEEWRGPAGSPALAAVAGGGTAIALANTAVPSRRAWHLQYYKAALGTTLPVNVGTVAAFSFLSGAVVLGGADAVLRHAFGARLG